MMKPAFVWWFGAREFEPMSSEQKDQILELLSGYAAQNESALNKLKEDIEKVVKK